MRLVFIIFLFFSSIINAAEMTSEKMPKHDWSFQGITGTFDRAAIQSGYKVFTEVCSGCHSMKLLYYRDLIDVGFSEAQVKVIASEYTILDGPNDDGEMFERPARPADRLVNPYANDNEARASNNGAYPPDLSVITKARKYGPDYIYNLLLGYVEPPKDMEVGNGMYYNKYYSGNLIGMPQPLYDDGVEYADGTKATPDQMAKDVTAFLAWASEPEMEDRKRLGISVMLFLLLLSALSYFAMKQIWAPIKKQ